jgi:hypothetical protein
MLAGYSDTKQQFNGHILQDIKKIFVSQKLFYGLCAGKSLGHLGAPVLPVTGRRPVKNDWAESWLGHCARTWLHRSAVIDLWFSSLVTCG